MFSLLFRGELIVLEILREHFVSLIRISMAFRQCQIPFRAPIPSLTLFLQVSKQPAVQHCCRGFDAGIPFPE